MVKIAKRIKEIAATVEAEKLYAVDEAVTLVKNNAKAKFDETIEIAMNLGVDPRHADQMVRGLTSLPNGIGKEIKVAVFAKGEKAEEARKAGADIVGDEDLTDQVKKGEINFDRVIATPDMMAKVGQLGKILGPKGLMPNPKLGTVTMDVAAAVKQAKAGQVEYKVEKNGIIHAGIGKASFGEKEIKENLVSFFGVVSQAKPSGAKGTYIQRVAISSTMGVAIKLDVQDLLAQKAA